VCLCFACCCVVVLLPVTHEAALQEVAGVLLNTITQPLSCEHMRATAGSTMLRLAKQVARPVSHWLRPLLAPGPGGTPPLVLKRVIPIRVSAGCTGVAPCTCKLNWHLQGVVVPEP
jgi:hypothetical protein